VTAVVALVVVLLGPPGAGKSTQAALLKKAHDWPTISAGDLLRAEAARDTTQGKRLRATMAKGELVDDAIVNELIAERIAQPDCEKGCVLDGYPRGLGQARFLDELLAERKLGPATIIHIDVPDATLVERLYRRRRSDDGPEVVRRRLEVYRAQTQPLVDFYRGRASYHLIRGDRPPTEVASAIERALQSRSARKSKSRVR
jgi:adenylate kinase